MDNRNIDRRIAVEVMGKLESSIEVVYEPKNYSTDISSAFEVVEKLIELDLWIQMEMSGKIWWACKFWNCKTGVHGELVHEKELPLAICKAALLSLEVIT